MVLRFPATVFELDRRLKNPLCLVRITPMLDIAWRADCVDQNLPLMSDMGVKPAPVAFVK